MAKNRNTYQILKSCFVTGGTSTLATVSNTYELFKAVYDTSAGALRISLSGGTGVSTLEGLTDTLITSPVGGQILAWNGSVWVNYDPSGDWVSASTSLFDGAFGSLTGVPTTIAGYGITDAYTKTESDGNYLTGSTTLFAPTVISPASGQILIYDTGVWKNQDTLEQLDFQIEFETGTTYKITPYAHYAIEVVSMYLESDDTSATITLSGASSAMGGISSVTGGTSGTVYTASTNNEIAIGEDIKMIVEAATDSTIVYGSLKIKRI